MTTDEEVLLSVEDSDADFNLIKMAVRNLSPHLTVYRAYDGEQAIAFLSRSGEYQRVPRPHLVLLDSQLPKMDGFGVLEYLSTSPELSSIPVVLFTASSHPLEIRRALALGARTVIQKPVRFDQFREQLRAVYQRHMQSLSAVA